MKISGDAASFASRTSLKDLDLRYCGNISEDVAVLMLAEFARAGRSLERAAV